MSALGDFKLMFRMCFSKIDLIIYMFILIKLQNCESLELKDIYLSEYRIFAPSWILTLINLINDDHQLYLIKNWTQGMRSIFFAAQQSAIGLVPEMSQQDNTKNLSKSAFVGHFAVDFIFCELAGHIIC